MPRVAFVCLANSIKHDPGRCIAGLRIDGGGWVRPISNSGEGELYPAHLLLPDGSEPRMLDVISAPLLQPSPSVYQPENWLIDEGAWTLVERPAREEYAALLARAVTRGPLLFGDRSRRVDAARFQNQPASASLALIHPERVSWITDSWGQNRKPKVCFRLGGADYYLPLTDPHYSAKLRALAVGEHDGRELGIPAEAKALLTISLAEQHTDGFCYKLAANVVLIPATWRRYFGPYAAGAAAG